MKFKIFTLMLAAAGLSVLAALPALAQSGGAIPGGVYEAFSEDAVGCDEGDVQNSGGFLLRLNPEGTRVVELISLETTFMGLLVGTVSIPADVPIAPDGTYSEPISLGPVVIRGAGRFDGETLTGSFRVELDGVLECEGTFVGQYVGQEVAADIRANSIVATLPLVGTGPASSGNNLAWFAVLAVAGAALLKLGAASLAKR